MLIVLRTVGFLGGFEVGRQGRAKGKEIDDDQSIVAPTLGKIDAPTNGGIVVGCVRSGWV